MGYYLFSALEKDPVLSTLKALKEGRGEGWSLFPFFLDFSQKTACTSRLVREYALRTLLKNLPCLYDSGLMHDYLAQDLEVFFQTFFAPDWEIVFQSQGLLPLPRKGAQSPWGEKEYRRAVSQMTRAGDGEVLTRLVAEFLTRWAGDNEAAHRAWRWDDGLVGVERPDAITFDQLSGLEHHQQVLMENTEAFLMGKPANDVLLLGASGTGKSSSVKATLNALADRGLGLVEVSRRELEALPQVMETLSRLRKKYIIFIDDLSFEGADEGYLNLKVALSGQVAARPDNVLIYATSNRRHLIHEKWDDRGEGQDIFENDTLHEKLSLSERFGIRLVFSVLSQQEYFAVVEKHLAGAGVTFTPEIGRQAAAWALSGNGRNGRTARQFTNRYLGSVETEK